MLGLPFAYLGIGGLTVRRRMASTPVSGGTDKTSIDLAGGRSGLESLTGGAGANGSWAACDLETDFNHFGKVHSNNRGLINGSKPIKEWRVPVCP